MNESHSRERPLRLWPAAILVVAQAIAVFGLQKIVPASPLHFFGVLVGAFIIPLLLLVWWVFFSRRGWRSGLGGAAFVVAAIVVTALLADPSARLYLMTAGVPLMCLVTFVWLQLSQSLDARRRRIGTIVVVLLSLVGWTLVRTNGVTGDIAADYAFRWSPTSEEQFLAEVDVPSTVVAPESVEALPATDDAEWPGFRGPDRDARIVGTKISTDWDSRPPTEVWRQGMGPGWSSFALVGHRLYTQEQRGAEELVTCYDAGTGDLLWSHSDKARFWESMAGAGPRATPTYDAGRLYALGATGILNALDAATGRSIWSRDLVEDTDARTPDWGFSSSPLVVGPNVIVHAGGPEGKGVVSYDADSGEPRWFAPAGSISYSSPHLLTFSGVPLVMMLTGAGATAIDPDSGVVLWDYEWPIPGGSRIVQPYRTDDDRLLIGTGFGEGVRSLEVAKDGGDWILTEGWTSRGLKPYYNDFVVHRGDLYGFDGAIMSSIDAITGERNWKGGRYGNGQALLLADQDLLLVQAEDGAVVLVAADPAEWREIARFAALDGKTWNHPVLVGDRLFVRNDQEAACYRLPQAE